MDPKDKALVKKIKKQMDIYVEGIKSGFYDPTDEKLLLRFQKLSDQLEKLQKTKYGTMSLSGEGKAKVKKPNAWIQHVKAVAKKEGLTYGKAISVASKTWKK